MAERNSNPEVVTLPLPGSVRTGTSGTSAEEADGRIAQYLRGEDVATQQRSQRKKAEAIEEEYRQFDPTLSENAVKLLSLNMHPNQAEIVAAKVESEEQVANIDRALDVEALFARRKELAEAWSVVLLTGPETDEGHAARENHLRVLRRHVEHSEGSNTETRQMMDGMKQRAEVIKPVHNLLKYGDPEVRARLAEKPYGQKALDAADERLTGYQHLVGLSEADLQKKYTEVLLAPNNDDAEFRLRLPIDIEDSLGRPGATAESDADADVQSTESTMRDEDNQLGINDVDPATNDVSIMRAIDQDQEPLRSTGVTTVTQDDLRDYIARRDANHTASTEQRTTTVAPERIHLTTLGFLRKVAKTSKAVLAAVGLETKPAAPKKPPITQIKTARAFGDSLHFASRETSRYSVWQRLGAVVAIAAMSLAYGQQPTAESSATSSYMPDPAEEAATIDSLNGIESTMVDDLGSTVPSLDAAAEQALIRELGQANATSEIPADPALDPVEGNLTGAQGNTVIQDTPANEGASQPAQEPQLEPQPEPGQPDPARPEAPAETGPADQPLEQQPPVDSEPDPDPQPEQEPQPEPEPETEVEDSDGGDEGGVQSPDDGQDPEQGGESSGTDQAPDGTGGTSGDEEVGGL